MENKPQCNAQRIKERLDLVKAEIEAQEIERTQQLIKLRKTINQPNPTSYDLREANRLLLLASKSTERVEYAKVASITLRTMAETTLALWVLRDSRKEETSKEAIDVYECAPLGFLPPLNWRNIIDRSTANNHLTKILQTATKDGLCNPVYEVTLCCGRCDAELTRDQFEATPDDSGDFPGIFNKNRHSSSNFPPSMQGWLCECDEREEFDEFGGCDPSESRDMFRTGTSYRITTKGEKHIQHFLSATH